MRQVDRARLAATRYPAARRVMAADGLRMGDAAVERVLARTFPDAEPEDVEQFMQTVQQFGRQAAPIAQRALPGVVQGAAQGAAVGGPYGAIIGGAIGGASRLAGGAAPPRPGAPPAGAPAMPPRAVATPPAPGATTGTPAAPAPSWPPSLPLPQAAPGVSSGAPPQDPTTLAAAAARELATLLARSETWQALLALAMSEAGRGALPVGTQQVAPAAFANAIAELAAIAATGGASFAGAADHLHDADDQPRGDLANPAERAAILLADLRLTDAMRARDAHDDGDDGDADDWNADARARNGAPERPDA